MEDNASLLAIVKDLKAENQELKSEVQDVKERLDRREKSLNARLDSLDSKAIQHTKKVSALDHKYVSVAGVTEVLKTNQMDMEKWLLSSMSQRPARLDNNMKLSKLSGRESQTILDSAPFPAVKRI